MRNAPSPERARRGWENGLRSAERAGYNAAKRDIQTYGFRKVETMSAPVHLYYDRREHQERFRAGWERALNEAREKADG
jgi:ribosomal protein L20